MLYEVITGQVLKTIDFEKLKANLTSIDKTEIESVAISLMNSYINPEHEKQIADFFINEGFHFVATSTGLSPLIKILNRAETTVVNSYLS